MKMYENILCCDLRVEEINSAALRSSANLKRTKLWSMSVKFHCATWGTHRCRMVVSSPVCLAGGGQPVLGHVRVGFPEQRDALPLQIRRCTRLLVRMPRRYKPPAESSQKLLLRLRFLPVCSSICPFCASPQATPTAPRRRTCSTTSVRSPTTSCEFSDTQT